MDTMTPAVSPRRQRIFENMRMRKLEPKTLEAYICDVVTIDVGSGSRPPPQIAGGQQTWSRVDCIARR